MTKLTDNRKELFILILSQGNSITAAARSIGVSRQAVYQVRETDEDFKNAWDNAIEEGLDTLEDEAISRAKKSSDLLLIFLLKGGRPDKYRERVDINVNWRVELERSGLDAGKVLADMVDTARQRLLLETVDSDNIVEGEFSNARSAVDEIGGVDRAT